jgi:hypothetical protein
MSRKYSQSAVKFDAKTFNESISQPQNRSKKGFLDLPRELRDRIYHHIYDYLDTSGMEPVDALDQMSLISK